MKTSSLITIVFGTALVVTSAFAQTETKDQPPTAATAPANAAVAAAPAAQPSAEDMQKMMQQMMEFSKLNENHKLLSALDGTWSYTVKMWMDGNTSAKPQESKGTAVRKSMMDGRFVEMDVTGKMQMPSADGKMKDMTFKGHAMEGYDNVKKKFVSTWMDNMGTGIMMAEGDYDAASKTLTYVGEFEMMPGMKQKIRETVKLTDKDHMTLEWFEDRGGQEMKTMQIDYTRGKK